MSLKLKAFISHKNFLLVFLWTILTLININKAFHIDDTFHLEAAQHMLNHPATPMSGFINWGDDAIPMSQSNHPVLFFYMIALVANVFGFNEIPLHLFLSVFTFLALFFFRKLAGIFSPENSALLLIFFAFCPAFIVNQNLMSDVPVMSLVLGMLYFLIKGKNTNSLIYYNISAFLLGLSLLIKFTALPFLVVMAFVILLNKQYKNLISLLIPVALLIGWSAWNYYEYGGIHILGREKNKPSLELVLPFLSCLGAMSTFIFSFCYGIRPQKKTETAIFVTFGMFFISFLLFCINIIDEGSFTHFLDGLFIVMGSIVLSILFVIFLRTKDKTTTFLSSDEIIVYFCLGALGLFIVFLAPFVATRHILLLIPFCLLLGSKLFSNSSSGIRMFSVSYAVALGIILGISDWKFADYYRQMSQSSDIPKGKNVWTIGHWGWQWYSKKQGMKEYNNNSSVVKKGDYFVFSGDVDKQKINDNLKLSVINKIWKESDLLTFFSGKSFGSMYWNTDFRPAWNFSQKPVDTIFVCLVENVNSVKVSVPVEK
jgi:4-amino-4-deoxy-L-arabinose transferase-like glycosyltransferase